MGDPLVQSPFFEGTLVENPGIVDPDEEPAKEENPAEDENMFPYDENNAAENLVEYENAQQDDNSEDDVQDDDVIPDDDVSIEVPELPNGEVADDHFKSSEGDVETENPAEDVVDDVQYALVFNETAPEEEDESEDDVAEYVAQQEEVTEAPVVATNETYVESDED